MAERPNYLMSQVFDRLHRVDLRPESLDGIMHNAQLKVYPDGSASLLASDRQLFREPGWELRKDPEVLSDLLDSTDRKAAPEGGAAPENVARARRRARATLVDLARSTNFRYFVTLTLDAAKIDRYDDREIIRKLSTWADNQVRRKGLAYVLVPERHKDGAVHFHGLINDALQLVDSGTMRPPGGGKPRKPRSRAQKAAWLQEGGGVVYNIPGWTLGYTTALELYGDRLAAIGYVTKYIGKDAEKIGGRWYYSGGPLKRPHVLSCDVDWAKVEAMAGERGTFGLAELNCRAARLELPEGGELHGWLEAMARA